MRKILVLAQIPPPWHGQSIMQEYLVNAEWSWCDKVFIRMEYSETIETIGKFAFRKLVTLANIIFKVWKERSKGKIDVLYYPPGGPHRLPFYRDAITLLFIRFCAKKIVLQFHAGAFDQLYDKLSIAEKYIAIRAYGKCEAAITLLPRLENEVAWIHPKRIVSIPNGIPDNYNTALIVRSHSSDDCTIITVGNLKEEKGIGIALQAIEILRDRGIRCTWRFMGDWHSSQYRERILEAARSKNILSSIEFVGIKTGDEKWSEYTKADIFCLPTFDTEGLPMTLIEAMMMQLPVVTTQWRAIPDIIQDTETGILVPPKDGPRLAEGIESLIRNPKLRQSMGGKAREHYLGNFTLAAHMEKMEALFLEIADG